MSRLIQSLEVVTVASEFALPGSLDDPPGILIDDPSDAGPSGSWGTGPLFIDPNTGQPVTGTDQQTRVPTYPPGHKRKRRKGGSGNPTNKNTPGPAQPGSTYCTTVNVKYHINVVSGPDIPGFGGQEPIFAGTVCLFWTTIDAANFPAEVAAQKAAYAAKAPDYLPIVNQKTRFLATAHADDPTTTYSATLVSATVTTPNPVNTCVYTTPNSCNDPNYT